MRMGREELWYFDHSVGCFKFCLGNLRGFALFCIQIGCLIVSYTTILMTLFFFFFPLKLFYNSLWASKNINVNKKNLFTPSQKPKFVMCLKRSGANTPCEYHFPSHTDVSQRIVPPPLPPPRHQQQMKDPSSLFFSLMLSTTKSPFLF